MNNCQHKLHTDLIREAVFFTIEVLQNRTNLSGTGMFATSLLTGLTLHQLDTFNLTLCGGEAGQSFELQVANQLPDLGIDSDLPYFIPSAKSVSYYLPVLVGSQLKLDLRQNWSVNELMKAANRVLKDAGLLRFVTPTRLAVAVRQMLYQTGEGILVKAGKTHSHYCIESVGFFYKSHLLAVLALLDSCCVSLASEHVKPAPAIENGYSGSDGIVAIESLKDILQRCVDDVLFAKEQYQQCTSHRHYLVLHNAYAHWVCLIFHLSTCSRHLIKKALMLNVYDARYQIISLPNKKYVKSFRQLPVCSLLRTALQQYVLHLEARAHVPFIKLVLSSQQPLLFSYNDVASPSLFTMRELNQHLFDGKSVNSDWPRKTIINYLYRQFPSHDVAAFVDHDNVAHCPMIIQKIANAINALLLKLINE
ncbi:hypothetical protein F9L16_23335 [Agarivorans sp. B2Z047]|uniref:hypothetical protein n=1 Tax=Agarivorans sp. B2Z047 TaxID=2652721 RepID=UPI00128DB920|nr:hypothetical protein [Agarivorans sp. B2Z047]MPW31893.1 hypothetical protein [Agarivorans sp. B2Z047]UQN40975.1 hypothetical protein LQZ07_14460 [Agarivorans sp. B2Z047]